MVQSKGNICLDWAAWVKKYPARPVASRPTIYHASCIRQSTAEIARDNLEMRESQAYEVVMFENTFFVIPKD